MPSLVRLPFAASLLPSCASQCAKAAGKEGPRDRETGQQIPEVLADMR